jgi:hypothetical protein
LHLAPEPSVDVTPAVIGGADLIPTERHLAPPGARATSFLGSSCKCSIRVNHASQPSAERMSSYSTAVTVPAPTTGVLAAYQESFGTAHKLAAQDPSNLDAIG